MYFRPAMGDALQTGGGNILQDGARGVGHFPSHRFLFLFLSYFISILGGRYRVDNTMDSCLLQ